MNKKIKTAILFIIIITFFYIINLIIYQSKLPNAILTLSEAAHFRNTIVFEESIAKLDIKKFIAAFRKPDIYAPFYTFTSACLAIIFDRNYTVMILFNNTFYLIILLMSGYLLASRIRDHYSGLLLVTILSLYPIIFGAYRTFTLEFALCGIIMMTLYLLFKTEYFTCRIWTILLAIGCAWGANIKYPFMAFAAVPILIYIIAALRKENNNKETIANICLFLVLLILLLLPHYLLSGKISNLFRDPFVEPDKPGIFSFDNIRYFTTGLWEHQLSMPFFILFVFGFFRFLKYRNSLSKYIIIAMPILPGLILFLMPHWMAARFLMPCVVSIALITAIGCRGLLDKISGRIILFLVICLGLYQYYNFSYSGSLDRLQFKINEKTISYYSFSECVSPLSYLQDRAGMMQSLLVRLNDEINLKVKVIGEIKEYIILFPYGFYDYRPSKDLLNTALWLNHIPAQIINRERIDTTLSLLKHPEEIDMILYNKPDNWEFELNDREFIQFFKNNTERFAENYFFDDYDSILKNTDWKSVYKKWVDFLEKFDKDELIYKEGEYEIYIRKRI